ncbi:MAG: hypothetical protein IPK80_12955 [Nannocystis sp.]|nr:hypothetical protein [Nannocystis sp.]
MTLLASLSLALCAALALSQETAAEEPAAVEAASGVSKPGRWLTNVSAGYPWWSARLQLGLPRGLSPLLEVNTALGRRWRPAVGLATLWVSRPHLRIGGEALFGWLLQGGDLYRVGPNVELRLRLAVPLRRAVPYVVLGSQHTLLSERFTTEREGGSTTRQIRLGGEWMGWASLGLIVAATPRLGIDFGVDLTGADSLRAPSIPGAHFGLVFGDYRRQRP